MTEALLRMLSMESPSTLLSIDTNVHEETVPPRSHQHVANGFPPDINLPLSSNDSMPTPSTNWLPCSSSSPEEVDVNLTVETVADARSLQAQSTSKLKRTVKRGESIWGAWFFFSHYFRPCRTDKMALKRDQFIVQHDMENMYMWIFRKRPENALGKMQLRSYMNGHARFGEPEFPFSVEKGFTRSHRMQRKHYRGLSNPQCIHGLEVVRNPNLSHVSAEDQKRWVELTGRELNFTLPFDASDYSAWRTLSCVELDCDRDRDRSEGSNGPSKRQQSGGDCGGSTLNLSCKLIGRMNGGNFCDSTMLRKKRDYGNACGNNDEECYAGNGNQLGEILGEEIQQNEQPQWLSQSSGVIAEGSGPVTGAKSIYEDEMGYLVMISLPYTDRNSLRVSWLNTASHGVVKVHCISTARMPVVIRGDRTFTLTDPNPEHCPHGEFVREIPLATRIPEDAELKAFYVESIAGLEIIVPKHPQISEEREVRVFLPPQLVQKAG